MEHGTVSRYSYPKNPCRCDKCRAAMNLYTRKRRANSPELRKKDRAGSKARNKALREYVNSLKDSPCVDCGVRYPPYVMHFDHLDGSTKLFGISKIPSRVKIDEEVLKCELVCANCHAERTHQRRLMQ